MEKIGFSKNLCRVITRHFEICHRRERLSAHRTETDATISRARSAIAEGWASLLLYVHSVDFK